MKEAPKGIKQQPNRLKLLKSALPKLLLAGACVTGVLTQSPALAHHSNSPHKPRVSNLPNSLPGSVEGPSLKNLEPLKRSVGITQTFRIDGKNIEIGLDDLEGLVLPIYGQVNGKSELTDVVISVPDTVRVPHPDGNDRILNLRADQITATAEENLEHVFNSGNREIITNFGNKNNHVIGGLLNLLKSDLKFQDKKGRGQELFPDSKLKQKYIELLEIENDGNIVLEKLRTDPRYKPNGYELGILDIYKEKLPEIEKARRAVRQQLGFLLKDTM